MVNPFKACPLHNVAYITINIMSQSKTYLLLISLFHRKLYVTTSIYSFLFDNTRQKKFFL